jgi:hypothetical protein
MQYSSKLEDQKINFTTEGHREKFNSPQSTEIGQLFVCVSLCASVAKINLLQRKTFLLSEEPARNIFEGVIKGDIMGARLLLTQLHHLSLRYDYRSACLDGPSLGLWG